MFDTNHAGLFWMCLLSFGTSQLCTLEQQHMSSLLPTPGKQALWLVCFFLFFCCPGSLFAEGTPNLRTANGDPVLLFIGEEDFGDFASYDGPENSRLNFRIGTPGEVVYFGMARLYKNSGIPENFGQYKFRVRRAVDGEVVFGPVTVNSNSENLTTYAQAEIGPDVLGVGGYPSDDDFTFTAPDAGEYYVEFEQNNAGRARYIGLWDITILNNGVEQTGRLYSKNWAFRVPELDPVLPDCAFGAELSTLFYSYTSDGFVTQIDFRNSGFQPLSFNLAFNRTGPGESGDLFLDRMSIPEDNATANAAQHLIFLSEPDANLFPDGECGTVEVEGSIRCDEGGSLCIPVGTSLSGQVEIILDFNGNGIYDEEIDRLILYAFDEDRGFSACVPWDGLRGDGMFPEEGATVDILVEYTQGLQHWALYDGELMRNGFCVTPIRPICGDGGTAALYYDDTNIPDEPGTTAPKKVLDGCECGTASCRTWTNFEANATDDCTIINENTTGYGDRNTLNTWWFASSVSTASFDVLIDLASLEGPKDHCPGDPVVIELNYNSEAVPNAVSWTGPGGPITTSPGQTDITVSESGLYTVAVTDELDCTSTADFTLLDVSCMLNVNILGVECQDNGTDTNSGDDIFFARVLVEGENSEGFRYNGSIRTYGEEILIGPFFIADGDVVFTAVDSEYDCCEESITITAPNPCSDGCAITVANIIGTECLNNGTPQDPSDDLFTFTMIIDGVNLGPHWTNDRGETGPYGEVLTFGPFLIADGAQDYEFTDAEDDDCFIFSTVQAPMPCSNDCELIPVAENVTCSDNGTPFDPTDDTYTFDLSVGGINTPSVAYSVNGGGAYLYNQTNTFGPYLITGDDFTFLISDLGGTTCFTDFTLENPPVTCSDACGLDITDTRIVCDDLGNDDPADDALYIEVIAESQNPNAEGWRSENGTEGGFGEYVRIGTIAPGGITVTVSITDLDNDNCTAAATVTSPELEISCPEDTEVTGHTVSLQTVHDSLTSASSFTAGDQAVCWLAEETFGSPRRYNERYTLQRTDTTEQLRLFSFYLYGPSDADLLGAVFSQMGVEQLDCCNLTNDGAVTAQPTNLRSLPVLPDTLLPSGLSLRQRFSVALRTGEEYSLITSSPTPGTTGEYFWYIVSADEEELTIDHAEGPAPMQTFDTPVTVVYDLLVSEADGILQDSASVGALGFPVIDALCGPTSIAFNDSIQRTCDRAQIFRGFALTAGDTTFNDACAQVITFRSLGLVDISWPEEQIRFGCSSSYPVLENGHPAPAYTGYPYVYREGIATALDTTFLDDLRISYEDTVEELTDGSRRITRRWTVIDLCLMESATYDQLFKLDSNGLPFFTCPINNHFCPIVEEDIMLWQVGAFDCVADVLIPAPELNNVCDTTDWIFMTEVLAIQPNGDTLLFTTLDLEDERLIEDLPPGDYLMHFIGIHPQETIDDRYCRFRVADLTEPVAVCKSNINLSVPGIGSIRVGFQVINQGSYDNCGIVLEEVRRLMPLLEHESDTTIWSDWGNFVVFDCEDVGLVWDMQYRLTDAAGNTNFCTSTVVITDNTNPYCTGLVEQFITCDSLPDDFSAFDTTALRLRFGMPEVIDNCSARAIELEPVVQGDDCSPEFIRRRFNAVDQHGNLSTGIFFQDINITPSLAYAIGFPADLETDCTDLTDTLTLIGTGCDSITVSYVDIPLTVQGEECRYFQRTFTATNWCEWDGVSPAIQIGRDEDCDNTNGEEMIWLVRTNDGIFVDADSLATNSFPAENVRGALCGGENPAGYFREETGVNGGRYTYSQRIKIFDTVAPTIALTMIDTICVDTSICRTPVTVGIEVTDACQVDEGQVVIEVDTDNDGTIDGTSATLGTFSGSFPNYTYTVTMPLGDHRFIFTVTDDCGNTLVQEQTFRVNDCYVPALVCRGDRIYELVPVLEPGDIDGDSIVEEAAVLIEAVDLAQCNFPDCSGSLIFSVNRVGERADRDQHTMFLDCGDRYQVALELYVWDDAFNPFAVQPDGTVGGNNWRMCVVEVFVQDPNLVCNDCAVEDAVVLGGDINTLSGEPMTAVTVFAGGDADATVTNGFGSFNVRGTLGGTYVIRPELEADPRDGLSTLDVLLLQYHLLGLLPITDPYQLLAADINRDGEITSQDMIMIQALVLGREDFYPEGSTWRFFPTDWDGTGNPPEFIEVPEVTDCASGHDFTAIKLGDLNNTLGANAGAIAGMESGVSRSRPVALSATEVLFSAGDEVTTTVFLPVTSGYAGGQAGFRWDNTALVLLDYSGEELTEENAVLRRNQLRLNWRTALTSGQVVTLTFRATASGKLSETLFLEDAETFRDEVYTTDLTTHAVFLNWNTTDQPVDETVVSAEAAAKDILLGVYPNPAVTTTRVGVQLVEAQRVRLTVYDVTGRLMLTASPELGSGAQWITVDVRDWPTGSYVIAIESKDGLLREQLVKLAEVTK